jgi:hypothetical protein
MVSGTGDDTWLDFGTNAWLAGQSAEAVLDLRDVRSPLCPSATGLDLGWLEDGTAAHSSISVDWLQQLSRRSHAAEDSVAGSIDALPRRGFSLEALLHSVDPDSTQVQDSHCPSFADDVAEEDEVHSVVDLADVPFSGFIPSVDARPGIGYVTGSQTPSLFSDHTSPRVAPVFDPTDTPASEISIGAMLQRLTFENQLLDDSIAATIQRVLAQGSISSSRLSEAEIRLLPRVQMQFDQATHQTCSICLEAFEGTDVVTALRCGHVFHVDCVGRWMQRATFCPLCRTPAIAQAQDSSMSQFGSTQD